MKTLPAGLQDHLDSGATTMCYCWRLIRKDGVTMGFTEHDEDLTFDGTTFEAASGFQATQITSSLGLNVDNLDVSGALSSDAIKEEDITAGRYDDSKIELWWVNFADVSQRVLMVKGNIGEVKQQGIAFNAELRSMSNRLNQKQGRKYQRTCDAVFGDERCKFNKASVTEAGTIAVTNTPRSFVVSGLSAANDFYSRGVLTWTSGSNNGSSFDVKTHVNSGTVIIELWTPCPFNPEVGDTFTIVAGCKQDMATCRDKFNNLANFQGFPHIPGNDVLYRTPTQGGSNQNGGSLVGN